MIIVIKSVLISIRLILRANGRRMNAFLDDKADHHNTVLPL